MKTDNEEQDTIRWVTVDAQHGELPATGWVRAFSASERGGPIGHAETGHGHGVITVAHDGIWVANRGSRTVARLDPRTLRVSAIQRFRKMPIAIAAGPAAVWAAGSNGWLWRIWPDGRGAEGVARLGRGATAVAAAGALIWVLRRRGWLYGLEPTSGEVVLDRKLPPGAGHMVADEDTLWIACGRNRRLVRMSPETTELEAEIPLPQPVSCLTVAGKGELLAGCARRRSHRRGWLHLVSSGTEDLAATVALPGQPRALAAELGTAWVACSNRRNGGGTIERIDLRSGEVARWRTTNWPVGSLALAQGRLLVAMSLVGTSPSGLYAGNVLQGVELGGGDWGGGGN